MGNEASRPKRFPLLRKKSPSGKDVNKTPGKTVKAASLSLIGFGRRKSSSNRNNGAKQLAKELDSELGLQSNQPERERTFSFEEQVVQTSLKTKVCLDDFSLVKTVGKGSFGRVIQVKKKDTGKIYAMKVLKKEQVIKRKQFEHTMAERRILEDIDHPFIVSLRYAFQTSQKLFMVFDFFNGGELFHYLSKTGRFGEERAKLYSAEILLGLEHVHNLNIIYRDLKPENLLLDGDGHICITDFGLSKENVVDDSVKSFCGTPEYLAPEVLKRQKYGKAVDWWSLGTLLYEMITGLPPFYDRNRERMYKKVLTADLRFPNYMSAESRSICRGMLQREPQQRLGYRGAQEIKTHPFYADLNWSDVYYKRITPKFVPSTSGEDDTRNVDKNFTSIPACVTPTPADSKLIDKEFTDFTFTSSNIINSAIDPNISVPLGNMAEQFNQLNLNGFHDGNRVANIPASNSVTQAPGVPLGFIGYENGSVSPMYNVNRINNNIYANNDPYNTYTTYATQPVQHAAKYDLGEDVYNRNNIQDFNANLSGRNNSLKVPVYSNSKNSEAVKIEQVGIQSASNINLKDENKETTANPVPTVNRI